MKLPRDVSGTDLVKGVLNYLETRQSGSHIRLASEKKGNHHVTIPKHDSLKLGTLASILDDVAGHHKLSRAQLLLLLRL